MNPCLATTLSELEFQITKKLGISYFLLIEMRKKTFLKVIFIFLFGRM